MSFLSSFIDEEFLEHEEAFDRACARRVRRLRKKWPSDEIVISSFWNDVADLRESLEEDFRPYTEDLNQIYDDHLPMPSHHATT